MSANDVNEELYEELRRLAARRMSSEPSDHTLQPTALVHEAWLRLQSMQDAFADRTHFFAAAATAMRHILTDRARRVRRVRHGGELERVPLFDDDADDDSSGRPVDMLELSGALERLETRDPELATVVTLRYVVGCTIEETAEILRVSPAKVKKDVAFARAWLKRQIDGA